MSQRPSNKVRIVLSALPNSSLPLWGRAGVGASRGTNVASRMPLSGTQIPANTGPRATPVAVFSLTTSSSGADATMLLSQP